ncbi:hypothetical protein, partial [Escherichia coli]
TLCFSLTITQLVHELTIPDKLWYQIQASKGTCWFPLMD